MTNPSHQTTNNTPATLLQGERVRLTACEPRDLPLLARWYQDTDFARRFDAAPAMPKTEKQVAEYIEDQQKSPTGYPFAIRLLDAEDMIGYCELDGILWNQGTGWLALAIGDPALRGQGYGTEALRLLLAFGFAELNLRRVQLTVFSYNVPAIRLYEKLGFQREGVFREFLHRDGRTFDMLLYGLLRREFKDTITHS
ncbi:MAG: GNAT family N-acetyltransferase [Anaerolineae bacterium]|nr:GNAT family N-acetyltransferase [Anaerolineae bacterium]